jgi:hypothetical protein
MFFSLLRRHHLEMMIQTESDSGGSDRLAEIAEILATGLMRLEARKSSRKPAEFGETSLHFSPDQSGDAASFSTGTLL